MAKYKLVAGQHTENGRTYQKGEVVDSPHDLAALFKEKFQVVAAPAVVEAPSLTVAPQKPAVKFEDDDDDESKQLGTTASKSKSHFSKSSKH